MKATIVASRKSVDDILNKLSSKASSTSKRKRTEKMYLAYDYKFGENNTIICRKVYSDVSKLDEEETSRRPPKRKKKSTKIKRISQWMYAAASIPRDGISSRQDADTSVLQKMGGLDLDRTEILCAASSSSSNVEAEWKENGEFERFMKQLPSSSTDSIQASERELLKRAFLTGCRDFEELYDEVARDEFSELVGENFFSELLKLNPHVAPQDYCDSVSDSTDKRCEWDLPSLVRDLVCARHFSSHHINRNVTNPHKIDLGTIVEVWWERDRSWHSGTVIRYSHDTGNPLILYSCGSVEGLDWSAENVKIRFKVCVCVCLPRISLSLSLFVDSQQQQQQQQQVPSTHLTTSDGSTTKKMSQKELSCAEIVRKYKQSLQCLKFAAMPYVSLKKRKTLIQDWAERSFREQNIEQDLPVHSDQTPKDKSGRYNTWGDLSRSSAETPSAERKRRSSANILQYTRKKLARVCLDSNGNSAKMISSVRSTLNLIGVSQRTVSRIIGCAQSTFSLWLNGSSGRGMYVEMKLLKWLNPEIAKMRGDKGKKTGVKEAMVAATLPGAADVVGSLPPKDLKEALEKTQMEDRERAKRREKRLQQNNNTAAVIAAVPVVAVIPSIVASSSGK